MSKTYEFHGGRRATTHTSYWEKDGKKLTISKTLRGFGGTLVVEDGDKTFDIEVVRKNENDEWSEWAEDTDWDIEEFEDTETDDENIEDLLDKAESDDEDFEEEDFLLEQGWDAKDDDISIDGELEISEIS
jgi:hypothetical protein